MMIKQSLQKYEICLLSVHCQHPDVGVKYITENNLVL